MARSVRRGIYLGTVPAWWRALPHMSDGQAEGSQETIKGGHRGASCCSWAQSLMYSLIGTHVHYLGKIARSSCGTKIYRRGVFRLWGAFIP